MSVGEVEEISVTFLTFFFGQAIACLARACYGQKPRSGTHVKRTGINKRTIGRCRVTTEKKQLYRHKSRDVVHVLIYVYGPPNGPPWSRKRSMEMDRYMDHLGRYIRTLIHVLSLVLRDQSIYSSIGYISSSTRVH